MIVPFCAFGFLVWASYERGQRVEYVTNTGREDAVVDATSPTGYAGGKRWLIVPDHDNPSYQWIAETQQMLAQHDWRVRHVDYDNAPFGRDVHSASVYRWWLGLLAWCDHTVSGRPIGLSVERAALLADPVLHLLLLAGTTVFVARCFGPFPAALLALGLAAIYPLAGGFLPGVPDDHSLAWACSLWSVLPLVAGAAGANSPAGPGNGEPAATKAARTRRRAHRFFFIAGVAGGLGLWVSAASQTPVLLGIALGGILAAWIASRGTGTNATRASDAALWQTWALGGATTCLAAYLVEYFPSHMDLRLQVNHPLYGVSWIGVGGILAQTVSWFEHRKISVSGRQAVWLGLATAAAAALPVALVLTRTQSLLLLDQLASQLSCLPDSAVARNFPAWLAHDGLDSAVVATCLPLLLLGPAVWLIASRHCPPGFRTALVTVLGPVLVTLILACLHLRWWNSCDCMLLVLMVAAAAANPHGKHWLWCGFAGLLFLPGVRQLIPPTATGGKIVFTRLEVEKLIERDLAHWIADHADHGGAVILASPDRTTSLCFHGGLRGLGSANWENRSGLEATVRIITATTADEARELLSRHEVSYLILPSWDPDLDAFVRWTLPDPEDSFLMAIHHWALPTWLQPLPYKLPANIGFEGQSVVIFKVTDESSRPASLSRLAEYFIESQQIELAASVGQTLRRYPTDLGALAALAEVEKARNDGEGFIKTFDVLLASVAGGSDRALAWDRRVSLAVVLAQGGRNDLAREQLQRCLEKIDETRLRSLTTGSLFRLQAMGKAFGLAIPDQRLRELAWQLLPVELRERL